MNEGDQAEQIACDKCNSIIVERRGRKKAIQPSPSS
jgi:ribosomal protein S27E